MTITVKFFASLSEHIGQREITLSTDSDLTLMQVWELATHQASRPEKLLMAINMDYAKPESVVHDGDEVAFFPPVTGG